MQTDVLILQYLSIEVEFQVLHITSKFGSLGHKSVGVVTRSRDFGGAASNLIIICIMQWLPW